MSTYTQICYHIAFSTYRRQPWIAREFREKNIKVSSAGFIKAEEIFASFSGWQDGYGAFNKSYADLPAAIEYIKNQEEHHKKVSYLDELRSLLHEAGLQLDERYVD